ncbi:RNA polymerase sigma-70 factor (ECF subfamily) [Nonomuraea thailandensis]|uniref:RNA polymerase sigma-70 factor (ECF subfamily) n=1 Tax=Nonomuraea thailandensis TaxID=1188745 RepID=A0A9X2K517_9ACTN|nr:RNA polymerase sigma factor [Nonomuraea thailandensis]MCP2357146.1 RNA polymerase sigma-70 factor (ECF subfamily) [Nonomuraea thailandensis]
MDVKIRARLLEGDQQALGELFDRYATSVYNHAYWVVGDWSAAEDVVSLTFMEVWRLRARLDPQGGSLHPWLLGVATNVGRNLRRARRLHREALAKMPRAAPVPDFADEVVGRITDAQRLEKVRAAIGRLRKHERDVLLLCAGAGLDYAEAAEALGIPIGTVRSRLSRARKKLELALTPVTEDGDRSIAVRPLKEHP